ncbi:MAG: DNA mismatch repair protein MutS [Flavobacteriaceae bacterium]|nr:DNA mismatch repair protein MutS [Flavobacteriaceae bacterium]
MKFKIGDNVAVLDDDFSGVVVDISGDEIVIQTDDGFQLNYRPEQLIRMGGSELILDKSQIDPSKDAVQKKKNYQVKVKGKTSQPIYEVDLHIEKLLPSTKGMDNNDILTHQLDTARRQLEFAIRKRMQRLVFIHGVGDGILKLELDYLFGRYSNVSYQDADYQKYGVGATEIFIKQGANRI